MERGIVRVKGKENDFEDRENFVYFWSFVFRRGGWVKINVCF